MPGIFISQWTDNRFIGYECLYAGWFNPFHERTIYKLEPKNKKRLKNVRQG